MTTRDMFTDFIPQKLAIKALRDSGYKNTAYALAELIDNAVQANADTIEIFCVEEFQLIDERSRRRIVQIGVLDNGTGMSKETLDLALQFGNGTHLSDRRGIGRFGMGLPNSSISQCRRVTVWTWEDGPDNALRTYLDVDAIESGELRYVPEPEAVPLPKEWRELSKCLDVTGTLVVWDKFDDHRLTWKTGQSLFTHLQNHSGRIYRRFIDDGRLAIRLAIVEDGTITYDEDALVNDPMYLMAPCAAPKPFDSIPMFQKYGDDAVFDIAFEGQLHEVTVRASYATQATVDNTGTAADRGSTLYGRQARHNIGVSVVRADREIDLDDSWVNGYDPRERWWGIEVDFPPSLDEIFGVSNNKQSTTVFTQMSQFDWETEAEEGEKYMDFKRRLQEDLDPRGDLLEVVQHIRDLIPQLRTRVQNQTKGSRSGGKRHDDISVEDRATGKVQTRIDQGYSVEGDQNRFDDQAYDNLVDDLKGKEYSDDVAKEIAEAVRRRGRRIIFVESEEDTPAFFQVHSEGSVTEVVFNRSHPAYEQLIRMLDEDTTSATGAELVSRIENASDTLKMLFASWARYEVEDIPSRERIREMRHEWGKMAREFLRELD